MSIREILRNPLSIRLVVISIMAILIVSMFGIGMGTINQKHPLSYEPNASPSNNYCTPVSENQWSQIVATGPGPRSNASMAYGSTTTGVVMFGGETFSGPNVSYLNQTWQYYSGSWINLTGTNSPPGMIGGAMQYDPSTGYIILFGGENSTSYFNNTWIFTGTTWSTLNFNPHPSARAFASMSYSPALNAIVLYGGIGPNGYLNSTWEFNGGWINITSDTKNMPSMEGASMASTSSGFPIIFGGYNSRGYQSSTWIMNQSMSWKPQKTVNSPGARAFSQMKFYLYDNETILFGGVSSAGPVDNTWAYSSSTSTWSQVQTRGSQAPAYFGQSMARYEANSTLILFGGSMGNTSYSDAYTFANITEYYVIFKEAGLPVSTEWGVQLGSTFVNSSSSTIAILAPTGTESFNITMVPSGYQTSQLTGNVTVYFEQLNQTITFNKIPEVVYYFYGAFAGIGLVVLALIITEIMRKLNKK
ncbi:MAG: Kelch repeat-containing protein [Thermoplasmataceae archaeon]